MNGKKNCEAPLIGWLLTVKRLAALQGFGVASDDPDGQPTPPKGRVGTGQPFAMTSGFLTKRRR